MPSPASSVFIAAGGVLIGVAVIDLLWDVKTIVERPFTEIHSEDIRRYYHNNLVDAARKAPLILAAVQAAFALAVISLLVELALAIRGGDQAAVAAAAVSMALAFPVIVLAHVSTMPLIATVEAGKTSLSLDRRHAIQRRVFFHHVWCATAMAGSVLVQILT